MRKKSKYLIYKLFNKVTNKSDDRLFTSLSHIKSHLKSRPKLDKENWEVVQYRLTKILSIPYPEGY